MILNNESIIDFYRFNRVLRYLVKGIAVVSNLIVFVVYFQGGLRKLSVSIYFRSIALFYSIQVLYELLITPYMHDICRKSELVYKFFIYLSHLPVPISVWFEVVASLDRFLSILLPNRFQFLHTKLIQRLVIVYVIAYNMSCYVYVFVKVRFIRKDPAYLESDLRNQDQLDYTLTILALVNSSAVPFLIMFVLSLATFVGVLRVHRRMKSTTISQNNHHHHNMTIRRDIKFGVTIISLNLLFFVFVVIYQLNQLVRLNPFSFRDQHQIFISIVIESILNDLRDYYYSLNFLVHLVVNSLVRRELWRLLQLVARSVSMISARILRIFKTN